MSWTTPETARLHELVVDPEQPSASRMTAIINKECGTRYTRNAVLGKIDRMRRRFPDWVRPKPLRRPSAAHKTPRKPARQQAANSFNGRVIAQPPSPVPPTRPPDLRIPLPQRRSISELDTGICRYPVGEPGTEGFFFCGGRAVHDRAYCRKHCAIAYRPVVRR